MEGRLTSVRIWVVKGIQEYHDYRLIHLSRSKYFSLNNKTHLDLSKLDQSTLDRTWFDLVLRAYANNVSAHNVRAYEGKALRMCRIVL